MREIRRRCPSPLRLHFCYIDFAADAPRNTAYHQIDEYKHDDNPASGAPVAMDGASGIENSNEEHSETHTDSAGDHVCLPAPFIGENGCWDADGYNYNGGHARGEEAGFIAAYASLLEDERCVLFRRLVYVFSRPGFPFPLVHISGPSTRYLAKSSNLCSNACLLDEYRATIVTDRPATNVAVTKKSNLIASHQEKSHIPWTTEDQMKIQTRLIYSHKEHRLCHSVAACP